MNKEYITEVVTNPLTKTFVYNTGNKIERTTLFITRDEAFVRLLNVSLTNKLPFSLSDRLRNYELESRLEDAFSQNSFSIITPCPFNG